MEKQKEKTSIHQIYNESRKKNTRSFEMREENENKMEKNMNLRKIINFKKRKF